jgi:hypothetical protein
LAARLKPRLKWAVVVTGGYLNRSDDIRAVGAKYAVLAMIRRRICVSVAGRNSKHQPINW